MPKDDHAFNTFLRTSCPSNLKLLDFNRGYKDYDLVQMTPYIDELQKWLKATTDEIYIQNFEISASDLCKIIKSSSECKRLAIRNSKIDIPEDLDFNIEADYKMSEISFMT